LIDLAQLFRDDKQLDAAEEAASRAINLLSEKDEQFRVCHCHHLLGTIYRSKGEFKKAVHHLEVALGIASPFNWHNLLFCIQDSLALLFFDEGRFDDAHAHIEHAKSHATNDNNPYLLARAMWRQAEFWHRQHRFEEAKSEALRALDAFEKLGAADDVERVRELLRQIDLMLVNRMTTVSSSQQCYLSCLLILRIQTGPLNPNDGIDTWLEFFRCILCKSPTPPPFTPSRVEALIQIPSYSSPFFPHCKDTPFFIYLLHPHASFHICCPTTRP
jgi:tetratricopeptide (TPR) repeat protein